VAVWLAPNGPIMIKAGQANGDGVALTEEEALDIADALNRLVRAQLDRSK